MCKEYYIDPCDTYLRDISATVLSSSLLSRFRQKLAKRIQTRNVIERNQLVVTIAPNSAGSPRPYAMLWGYNTNDPLRETYTADVRNIEKDPRYKEDWLRHRCIFPATFLIEQIHLKANDGSIAFGKEVVVQPSGQDRIWIAGIYRIEEGLPRCIMLTQRSTGDYAKEVCETIPVMFPEDALTEWIAPGSNPRQAIRQSLLQVVHEDWIKPEREPYSWD